MKIVLASDNPGKLKEISDLFAGLDAEIVPQVEYGISTPPETGTTFIDNALLKARYASAATGLAAIADDSGLAVDVLDGRPGVFSARYAGETASDSDNVNKLLDELDDIDDERRGAGFHCAAVLVFPGDSREPLIAEGVWRGAIIRERRGEGGFGYDPVFLDPDSGKTGAQMTRAEKNIVSHRGTAFRSLLQIAGRAGL
ncbi:MAG: RdgB/HAM1 family non-canonical purine NTP pyrophosphatase [Gammaproteobacteria bacterium]